MNNSEITNIDTNIKGRIHSFESMGLVDGPGVRFVVFFQGCKLRCSFCHNPDTWEVNAGTEITAGELIKKILRYKPYYKASGGGVTFSGGEPLMQSEFLTTMLKLCKENDIHTAVDTAGIGPEDCREIISLADLIMLDVKHLDPKPYKEIVGRDMDDFNNFADQIHKINTDLWLRAVIVPTINNNSEYIDRLVEFALSFPNIKKVELLPYHTLGVNKYEALGIKYRLDGVAPMDKAVTHMWQEKINSIISKNRG